MLPSRSAVQQITKHRPQLLLSLLAAFHNSSAFFLTALHLHAVHSQKCNSTLCSHSSKPNESLQSGRKLLISFRMSCRPPSKPQDSPSLAENARSDAEAVDAAAEAAASERSARSRQQGKARSVALC